MLLDGLDLYALKYFFDAIELSSMTRAAEMNHVTRSAVSQAIVRLEAWAGYALLVHEKRSVKLSSRGEAFYRRMKASYDTFASSLSKDADTRSLAVGCSASLLDEFLMPRLRGLRPLDTLKIATGSSTELSRKLSDGSIRVTISIEPGASQGRVIAEGRFVLASTSGRLTETVVVTESRPEVVALRRLLPRSTVYLTVESWTLAAKVARELGCSVLIPDFLVTGPLKKIDLKNFKSRFKVTLRHAPRHLLSKSEIALVENV